MIADNPLFHLQDATPLQVGDSINLPKWWRHSLPQMLVDFYSHFRGGAGWVGDGYLNIWDIDDLPQFNNKVDLDARWKNFLFFGTNGGGEDFGITLRDNVYVFVASPAMDGEIESVLEIGNSREFFEKLSRGAIFSGS